VDESAGIKVHLALKGKGYDSKSAIEELKGAKGDNRNCKEGEQDLNNM